MRSSSFVLGFIICLWIFLTHGVFGDEADEMKTEEVMTAVGQSVTLHTGVEEYHQINWWLENSNIALCRVNTTETRSCEITDERFRDRLKIDNQTGSLTIINISKGLTGLYKVQIISSSKKSSYKEFSVTVSAPLPVPTIVPEQSSCPKCLMQCSGVTVTLSWYKGTSSFSSISVSDLSSSVSVLLKVNDQDFSIYSCVMNDSISSKTKQLNITEICQPCPGVFGAGKDEMKTEEVKKVEGESATLHTGVEEYLQIIWSFENRNIALCRVNTTETRSCEITDERLRDRLKIHNQTGSLTIINISTELTGLYKLQIISSSKKSSYKEFNVTVSEADLEPDHTKLKWGLGLGLLVLVGVVIYCCCCRKAGGNGVVYQYVKNGGTVFRKITSRSDEESPSGNNE